MRLAYGKTGLDVTLPDALRVDVVRPKYAETLADQAGAVQQALRSPIGLQPLSDLVRPSDTVGIVCNDITRATPYQTLLPALLDELRYVPDEAITLLIATGTHRPNTTDELKTMLGAADRQAVSNRAERCDRPRLHTPGWDDPERQRGVDSQGVPALRRADSDRLHRAAFLCGFLRRRQGVHAGAGAAGDRFEESQSPAISTTRRLRGA